MQIKSISPLVPYVLEFFTDEDYDSSQVILIDIPNRRIFTPMGIIFEDQDIIDNIFETLKKNRPDVSVPTLPQEIIRTIGRANEHANIKTSEFSKVDHEQS